MMMVAKAVMLSAALMLGIASLWFFEVARYRGLRSYLLGGGLSVFGAVYLALAGWSL